MDVSHRKLAASFPFPCSSFGALGGVNTGLTLLVVGPAVRSDAGGWLSSFFPAGLACFLARGGGCCFPTGAGPAHRWVAATPSGRGQQLAAGVSRKERFGFPLESAASQSRT